MQTTFFFFNKNQIPGLTHFIWFMCQSSLQQMFGVSWEKDG